MKSKRTIGIVGSNGYVGRAMFAFFDQHYTVVGYDKIAHQSIAMDVQSAVAKTDVGIVCVPTPIAPDGSCDTSVVEEVVGWMESPLIIVKSTVEPGTTDRLKAKTGKRIVFAPEYAGESGYWSPYKFHTDVKETPFFVFGGSQADTKAAVDLYMPVTGPVKTYRQTTALAAEMAKYMENCFYATKITFCYEMACLCESQGVDYNELRELWLLDPRINPMHTSVFAENDRPYAGRCLPKDISALVRYAERTGYEPKLLKEVMASNERIGKLRTDQRTQTT